MDKDKENMSADKNVSADRNMSADRNVSADRNMIPKCVLAHLRQTEPESNQYFNF